MRKKARTDLRYLRHLFGEPVVYLAGITDVASLQLSANFMDGIHDGADALLKMRGNLQMQHGYVSGLSFTVRLVLCMWLMDTELASKLIRAAYAKA